MGVASTDVFDSHNITGTTPSVPAPFRFERGQDLIVTLVVGDVRTLLVYGVDYTVDGGGVTAGGTVNFTPSRTETGTIEIERSTQALQDLRLKDTGAVDVVGIERGLDRVSMLLQEVRAVLGRSFRFALSLPLLAPLSPLAGDAGKVLRWNDTLTGFVFGDVAAWKVGSGAPASDLGVVGDVYLDLANGDFYGPKTGAGWGAVAGNLRGPMGEVVGPAGATALAPAMFADGTGKVLANPTALQRNRLKYTVGQSIEWNGVDLPADGGFAWEDGAALSRVTYAELLGVLTKTAAGTSSNGSATVSGLPDLRGIGLEGARIEGPGLGATVTVSAIAASSITLSSNAGAGAGAGTFRIFPHGNGDGSTTFNLPNSRGRTAIGRDDMGGTAAGVVTDTGTGNSGLNAKSLGKTGGVDRRTQTTAEMPAHAHGVTDPTHSHTTNANQLTSAVQAQAGSPYGVNNGAATVNPAATGISINNNGSGNAAPLVQPSIVKNKIIFHGV